MPLYEHHFSNRNIPFGIATSRNHREPQGATRLGNHVVFLGDCQKAGLFNGIGELPAGSFARDALNDFASLPKHVHREVRLVIQQVHGDCDGRLNTSGFPAQSIEHISSVTTHMPVRVGDFVGMSFLFFIFILFSFSKDQSSKRTDGSKENRLFVLP